MDRILLASSSLRNSPCTFEDSFPGPPVFLFAAERCPVPPTLSSPPPRVYHLPPHNMIPGRTSGWVTLAGLGTPQVFHCLGSSRSKMNSFIWPSSYIIYSLYPVRKTYNKDFPVMLLLVSVSHLVFMWLFFPPVLCFVLGLSVIGSTSVHYFHFCVWRGSIDILDNCLMHHLVLIASCHESITDMFSCRTTIILEAHRVYICLCLPTYWIYDAVQAKFSIVSPSFRIQEVVLKLYLLAGHKSLMLILGMQR